MLARAREALAWQADAARGEIEQRIAWAQAAVSRALPTVSTAVKPRSTQQS